jgi:squalene synthase HpnC
MPVSHYENFPVASVLLSRRLRQPIEAIYWFARSADDIADEGEHLPDWRLTALDGFRTRLDEIEAGVGQSDTAWAALARTIVEWNLPLQPFRDLLDAFAQDVVVKRYPSFADLSDYCRRSANPVGRLLLHLFDCPTREAVEQSDAICTSLQLLNFCQDIAADWRKGRLYIPQDEMSAARVTEVQIAGGIADSNWRRLFELQLDRALALLRSGASLPERLHGRPRFELRAIIAGGERIGSRLRATRGNVFAGRPTLHAGDRIAIAFAALRANGGADRAHTYKASPS